MHLSDMRVGGTMCQACVHWSDMRVGGCAYPLPGMRVFERHARGRRGVVANSVTSKVARSV